MDPQEFIDKFYLMLLDAGWKMHEIDEMDIVYYLKVKMKSVAEKKVYIDHIL